MVRVKEALGMELGLQLLESHRQIAGSLGRQGIAVQLVGTVPWKHGDPPGHHHFHAVFRPKAQLYGAALEHDAAQCALRVLQGKVVMAGGVYFIVGELAPDCHIGQHRLIVQQQFYQMIHFGDAEDVLFHRVSLRKKTEPDKRWHCHPAPLCHSFYSPIS